MPPSSLSTQPSLHVSFSNHIEALGTLASTLLHTHTQHPFQRSTVIIPNHPMWQWLQQRFADQNGCCANIRGVFLRPFMQQIASGLPEPLCQYPFSAQEMQYSLDALLAEETVPSPENPTWRPITQYLLASQGKIEKNRLSLSSRIAQTFENYLMFRPDWLEAWQQNKTIQALTPLHQNWQSELWRKLLMQKLSTLPSEHPLLHLIRNHQLPQQTQLQPQEPIIGFALPTLPPLYLQVLLWLSRFHPVYLCLLHPSQEYWGTTPHTTPKLSLALQADESDAEHPLLNAWGSQYRAQMDAILELNLSTSEHYIPRTAQHALATLQNSLLCLQPYTSYLADDSLQIHHSREMLQSLEVLHTYLLKCFAEMPSLRPNDVLILVPDTAEIAPYFDSVFNPPGGKNSFPFRAISTPIAQQPFIQAWQQWLALIHYPQNRFTHTDVLTWLHTPYIRESFELSQHELHQIEHWLEAHHILWGIDASHLAALDIPEDSHPHTWQQGLNSLLLGFLFPDQTQHSCQGLTPTAPTPPDLLPLVSKFFNICQLLFQAAKETQHPKTIAQWSQWLQTKSLVFYAPTLGDGNHPLQAFLENICQESLAANHHLAIDFESLQHLIHLQLNRIPPHHTLGNGMSISAINRVRNLPYRVVCLVNFDAERFPRPHWLNEWDLMAESPRRNDPGSEDNTLFLDAILCAQERLFIGYYTPPSELEAPCTPLQTLIAYLTSRSEQAWPIQQHLLKKHQQPSPKTEKLDFSAQPPGEITLTLKELQKFFEHPCRYFSIHRLGAQIPSAKYPLGEPGITLTPYYRNHLVRTLLQQYPTSLPTFKSLYHILTAQRHLPAHTLGEAQFEQLWTLIQPYQTSDQLFSPPPHSAYNFNLSLPDVPCTLKLHLSNPGCTRYVFAQKASAVQQLNVWLHHIARCCNPHAVELSPTEAYFQDQILIFSPMEYATARLHLQQLLKLFYQGLSAPLAFFPHSSWQWFSASQKAPDKPEDALSKAYTRWEKDGPYTTAEKNDPYYRLLSPYLSLGIAHPQFQSTANDVWLPAKKHLSLETKKDL